MRDESNTITKHVDANIYDQNKMMSWEQFNSSDISRTRRKVKGERERERERGTDLFPFSSSSRTDTQRFPLFLSPPFFPVPFTRAAGHRFLAGVLQKIDFGDGIQDVAPTCRILH